MTYTIVVHVSEQNDVGANEQQGEVIIDADASKDNIHLGMLARKENYVKRKLRQNLKLQRVNRK